MSYDNKAMVYFDHTNRLAALPTHLTSLHIGVNNKMRELPEALFKLKSLSELHLNLLPRIKSLDVQRLPNLRSLKIGSCYSLTMLNESITGLKQLEDLEIRGCNFVCVPDQVYQMTNLRFLTLSGGFTYPLSDALSNLSQLESLSLQYCQFSRLPNCLSALGSLTTLSICWCPMLESLPASLPTGLKSLHIKDNNLLSAVPSSITSLTRLEDLRVQWCPNLTSFPTDYNFLWQLKEFMLENCPVLDKSWELQHFVAVFTWSARKTSDTWWWPQTTAGGWDALSYVDSVCDMDWVTDTCDTHPDEGDADFCEPIRRTYAVGNKNKARKRIGGKKAKRAGGRAKVDTRTDFWV